MVGRIGVLALQGGYGKHLEALERCKAPAFPLYHPHELDSCVGLILPGGESTTIWQQLEDFDFLNPLKTFAEQKPLFGTCAGMILMSRLHLLSITVERNGYGRQKVSFSTPLTLEFSPSKTIEALFIRAPKITSIDSPDVKILARNEEEVVCIQQGIHLACSFHPELTTETTLHEYFISLCKEKPSLQPL
ncbi:MAG: Pyridoxal 5'-phosphate synthase subunit PdxT [Chlamydiae bacterium]|nr:Pyridoxal 5'-phosphate synthase subunit PdxT [Chlamydiota bacterium]